jgi:hypothetical protein
LAGGERAARLIGGGLILICGVVALHAWPLGLPLSGAGVVTPVTGVFGYCLGWRAVADEDGHYVFAVAL